MNSFNMNMIYKETLQYNSVCSSASCPVPGSCRRHRWSCRRPCARPNDGSAVFGQACRLARAGWVREPAGWIGSTHDINEIRDSNNDHVGDNTNNDITDMARPVPDRPDPQERRSRAVAAVVSGRRGWHHPYISLSINK